MLLFSVQSSSAKKFNFNFYVSMQSSVLFWSRLMTCSFHVSLLFDLLIKLLSELMILSSVLMNFRFVVDFNLHKHENIQFSIFDLQHSHLWSYWVEWKLVLIIQLCSITCWLIWYIICFDKLLSLSCCILFCKHVLCNCVIDNEIYLYEMLTTNFLQAMLVKKAEQSHQH